MSKLIYKLKNDRLFLILFAVVSFVVLFDLFMIVYDIVQFVKISKNSVDLFASFISLNLFAGVVNILVIAAIVAYFVVGFKRLKVDVRHNKK